MYCKNCGSEIPENVSFCPKCGVKIADESAGQNTYDARPQEPVYRAEPACPGIAPRNVGVALLLTFVTCGFYGIYWIYCLVRDTKLVNGEGNSDLVIEFLLMAFVPFYDFYWFYTRDQKLAETAARLGVPVSDNAILYLLLAVFGLGIVSIALMQNDLNKFAE